jgi:AraC-like DNA-binding protein
MDEVMRLCPSAFYAHDLDLLHAEGPFDVRYRINRVGPLTLGDITYGADVRLDFHELVTGYHVNIPVHGMVESHHRGRRLPTSPDLAAVYQPSGETVFTRWPAQCRTLAVKIDKSAVDHALGKIISPRPARTQSPGFRTGIDLATGAGRSWAQLLLTAGRQLGDGDSLLHNPLVAAPFAESIVNGFLLAAHPAYQTALGRTPDNPAPPDTVRTAVDLIESDPQFPWTTGQLAERCHVRTRTLQNGFRRYLDTTPMEYVRAARLRQAHDELQAASPHDTTVARIAHRWGFTHLSRFGAAYKDMYGEPPGHTLRT